MINKKRYFQGIFFFFFILMSVFLLMVKPWEIRLDGKGSKEMKETSSQGPSHSMRDPDSQDKEKAINRQVAQASTIFELFELSEAERESFYRRRYEPREVNLAISGLKIDRKPFNVKTKEDLPERLGISLPGGEGEREFTRTFVDFEGKDGFVWVGVATDNKFDSFHLSVYQGAIVGSIETQEGSYEIKYFSEDKNIIRKLDRKQFPENPNDAIFPKGYSENSNNANNSNSFNSNSLTRGKSGVAPSGDPLTGLKGKTQGAQDESVEIDMVLGYSHLLKESEGSLSGAKAFLNLIVSFANTTHRNSETGVVLNVQEMMELNVASSPEGLGDNLDKMADAYDVETGGVATILVIPIIFWHIRGIKERQI